MEGFEPPTSRSQAERPTKLAYTQISGLCRHHQTPFSSFFPHVRKYSEHLTRVISLLVVRFDERRKENIGRDIANLPPTGVHFSFQVIMPFAAGPVLRSRCAFTLNNPLCYTYAKYRIDIACSLTIPRSSVHSAWRMYVHCQWDTRYVMAIYVHTLKDTIQDSSDNIF